MALLFRRDVVGRASIRRRIGGRFRKEFRATFASRHIRANGDNPQKRHVLLEDTVGGVKRNTTRELSFQRRACSPSVTSIRSSLAFRVGSGKNHYESTKSWRTLPDEMRLTKHQKSPNDY